MSDQRQHNDDLLAQRLKALTGNPDIAREFTVPDQFFAQQTESILLRAHLNQNEFETPENYFEEAQHRLLAAVDMGGQEEDEFFRSQQDEILDKIKLDEFGFSKASGFDVPEHYFQEAATEIISGVSTSSGETRVIPFYKTGHARMWMAIAAAACIAFLAVMIWPQNPVQNTQSGFAELLERTELDEADLEYFAGDEEYDELLMEEIDLLIDTTITDTLELKTPIQPATEDPKKSEKEKKDKKEIKPNDKKKTPSFDDLTEDEILEFLLEEGGDDLLDDL